MNLIERAKNICLTPETEWAIIAAEPSSIRDIYRQYAMPLGAFQAGCATVGAILSGGPFVAAVAFGIFHFAASMAGIYVVARVVDMLAPTFGGVRDPVAAFKAVAYSNTPIWLAGVFSLVPFLSLLAIVGLYGAYLLYLGLPRMMRSAEDKSVAYTAVSIVLAIVVWIVLIALIGLLTRALVHVV
jgi:hypothetical protein